MTLQTTNRVEIYRGNGSTTTFPWHFRIDTSEELTVSIQDYLTGDILEILTPGSYTATGFGNDSGGQVEYQRNGAPLPNTLSIVLLRTVEYTQDMDISPVGGFNPTVVEQQLDRIVMQIQQIAEVQERSLVVNPGQTPPDLSVIEDAQLWGERAEAAASLYLNVTMFGASTGNVSALNDAAFTLAEAVAGNAAIYVPAGTFKLSTPLVRGYKSRYYGPGVLQFDNAEWLRPGGSSGSVGVPEKYTLFYDYANQSDVSVSFNGVGQVITWIDDSTVQAPGSLGTDAVRINIVNGFLRLGPTPVMIRSFNVLDNPSAAFAPNQASAIAALLGYCNHVMGTGVPSALTTGINNTIAGIRSGRSLKTGNNNTFNGFQAGYRTRGNGNTFTGSISGEWNETGEYNSFHGALAGAKMRTGNYNSAQGYDALGENETGSYITANGHRALANPREEFGNASYSSAHGAFAGDFAWGQHNTWGGYRAGNGVVGGSDGTENVAHGSFAMQYHAGADYNSAYGVTAGRNITSGQHNFCGGHSSGLGILIGNNNIALGQNSLQNSDGNNRIAIGTGAGANLTSTGSIAIGLAAATAATSADSLVAIGSNAGVNLTTGTQATILGANAGRFDFGGTPITTFTNFTVVGYDARVSGSNQVQLGNSATTTYVYGTVQNRSDERDKTDIRKTSLGLDWVRAVAQEAVIEARWDLRDDYIDYVETEVEVPFTYEEEIPTGLCDALGNEIFKVVEKEGLRKEIKTSTATRPRDGSMKRSRFHQFFSAQKLKEINERMGVDFGGLQDHSINGGQDVMSVGYDEGIPPAYAAIDKLAEMIDAQSKLIKALQKEVKELKGAKNA